MKIMYAYLRCSDVSQHLDRQYEAISKYANIPQENYFADKISGRTDQREQYQALKVILSNLSKINQSRPEDSRDSIEVIIQDLDRLGRTKKIIRDEMEWFSKNNIKLRILEIPTTLIEISSENDWVLDLVNRILIEVYTALAEQEFDKRERRQREGIEAAKLKGVYKGRKPIPVPDNFDKVYIQWKNKNITAVRAMELLNLKPNTFYKMIKQYEQNLQFNK
jgi:DNA invertase Pin-like site-specific DNA recombinase